MEAGDVPDAVSLHLAFPVSERVSFALKEPGRPPAGTLRTSSGTFAAREAVIRPPGRRPERSSLDDHHEPGRSRSLDSMRGDVAQLVEHLLCKQGVGGSSPLVSTIEVPGSAADS
jgi:hypothetical protein